MAKHALPEAAYESRIGHVQRGVNHPVYEQWSDILFHGPPPTSHAACDCLTIDQHITLAGLCLCPGPLATIHVERRRADEMAARALMERCPWLTYHDAKTLARWKPGDPVPITGAR